MTVVRGGSFCWLLGPNLWNASVLCLAGVQRCIYGSAHIVVETYLLHNREVGLGCIKAVLWDITSCTVLFIPNNVSIFWGWLAPTMIFGRKGSFCLLLGQKCIPTSVGVQRCIHGSTHIVVQTYLLHNREVGWGCITAVFWDIRWFHMK